MGKKNRRRVDPLLAIVEHDIYRDIWERKMLFNDRDEYLLMQGGCRVIDDVDYPEWYPE